MKNNEQYQMLQNDKTKLLCVPMCAYVCIEVTLCKIPKTKTKKRIKEKEETKKQQVLQNEQKNKNGKRK